MLSKPLLLSLLISLLGNAALARGTAREATIEARVATLMSRMTMEEKLGQLHLVSRGTEPAGQIEEVRQGRIGGVLNVGNGAEVRRFQEAALQSRLRIPLIMGIDAVHVFRVAFPVPIAWAAAWDPKVAEEAAYWVAREASAQGINWTFAPMVDVTRDPRWGRVIEAVGEDAFLGASQAAARVRGYRRGGMATAVKHFIGYGASEAGRDYNSASVPVSELYDYHLPPFKAALDAGSETVLASFNTLNGVPVSAHRGMLTELLRRRLGFDGFVTSDYNAVGELMRHGIAPDLATAARKALHAGVDIDMEGTAYVTHLAEEVRAGRVPMAQVDAAVRRVLRVKGRLGLLDPSGLDLASLPKPVDEAAVRAAAREAARQSHVLLKNANNVLPITPAARSIVIIGPHAESDYDASWYGPALLTKPDTVTLLQAMRAELAPDQRLTHARGFTEQCGRDIADQNAVLAAVRDADVVVFLAMEDCGIWGEGISRAHLGLSGAQQQLLDAVAAQGKPVVLVVHTGRPLALLSAEQRSAAVLVAWHGGTEGRIALAETLFGKNVPSGKLPMTFPRSVGQIPIYYNQLPTGRPTGPDRYTSKYIDEEVQPLFPFGWGLSYTTFEYQSVSVSAPRMTPNGGSIDVTVNVRNSGLRAGREVVQLYVRQLVASRSRPVRELKGFEKVVLEAGETKAVRFQLAATDLGYHDDAGNYIVEPGPFEIYAGGDSRASLTARFEIAAD